jgi:hypothetical protein
MLQPYADGICARHSSASALLAHALPVVSNEGRFTEPLWRANAAVTLVGADTQTFGATALSLLEDASERARLSSAASALYDAHFDVRHTVEALRA